MNKFSKILALGLAGASVLTGGFILSGCDKKDKDATQVEQNMDIEKGVIAISIKKNSLPKYIIKGKFSRTNIKMVVTYDNYLTNEIKVTESMFDEHSQQELKQAGQYNLTINFGGQTATFYANVVDERYLLKEVVEANINKDITISTDSSATQIDKDNQIIAVRGFGYSGYAWVKNKTAYYYDEDNGVESYSKELASGWDQHVEYSYTKDILNILETSHDSNGNSWKIESVEGDGVNYTLTAINGDGKSANVREYVFNEDFLSSVTEYKQYENKISGKQTFTYNYTPITLEFPGTIETDTYGRATVNYNDQAYKLNKLISKYLEKDLEVTVDGTSIAQLDVDNQVMNIDQAESSLWMWVSGDSYLKNIYGSEILEEYNTSMWEDDLADCIFKRSLIYKEDAESRNIELSDGYYIITVQDKGITYRYIFNDEEIKSIEINDNIKNEVRRYKNTNINLYVPYEINQLEDRVLVDADTAIETFNNLIAGNLNYNLEKIVRDNLDNESRAQHSHTNNVIYISSYDGYNEWGWANEDYFYSLINGNIAKKDVSRWQDYVKEHMFVEAGLDIDQYIATMSPDGQQFEFIIYKKIGEILYEYKYVFNDNRIEKRETRCNGQQIESIAYNINDNELTVPDDIKALESFA